MDTVSKKVDEVNNPVDHSGKRKVVDESDRRLQSSLVPKKLMYSKDDAVDQPHPQPSFSEPVGRKKRPRGDDRTTVLTAKGRQVLSSDMRLHLEKMQAKKAIDEARKALDSTFEEDVEFAELEAERKILEAKLAKHREIRRLKRELQQLSSSKQVSEYQTKDSEGSEADDSDFADSTNSFRSRSMSQRRGHTSSHGSDNSVDHSALVKLRDEVALCTNFIRNQSGVELPIESPLSTEIENAKIDRHLKIPPIDQFDGSSDPNDFLNVFDVRMSFFGHSEIARCRFFCTCLEGTALRWFNNLPPRTIDSWHTLKSKFRGRFSSNRKSGKITASLLQIKQKRGELLRDYLSRFRSEIAEIPNLVDELAVNYLAAGIDGEKHSRLLEELLDKQPATLQAAYQILEHRITLQEAVGSIQRPPPNTPRSDRTSAPSPRWSSRRDDRRSPTRKENDASAPSRSQKQWQPRPREEKEFTKLNTDKATILAIIKSEPGYRPPRPMNPNRPPNSRYCDYHEDFGHTTERCFQLSSLVESRIKRGQFVHFVQQDNTH